MRNLKVTMGFRGTNYHGFQRQPNGITVQEVVETALSKLFNEPVTIQGCSRTDTGVHAKEYCFTMQTEKQLPERNFIRGACGYLPDEKTPVVTDASEFMVREARKHSPENPLYIVSIAAATNAASAILTDPVAMTENVVHIWLGGHALHWVDTKEFNMKQDIAAARVLFGCGAPLVQLPCNGVASGFTTTEPELRHYLKGKNPLCDYLLAKATEGMDRHFRDIAWDRAIWDVTAVGWLLNEKNRMMLSYLRPALIPQYDGTYSEQPTRHPMRYVYFIKRYDLMTDLFLKLAGAGQ